MVRHDEALANNPNAPAHARDTWRRLAVILAVLAPAPPDTLGKQALRFYIPDGKYRQQVFALEETKTAVLVYLPDVLAAALDKNILEKSDHEHVYVVAGHPDASLRIEVLAADTPDVTTAKPMLGWGRRALRVTLGPLTGEKHLTAVENLLALAPPLLWSGRPPGLTVPAHVTRGHPPGGHVSCRTVIRSSLAIWATPGTGSAPGIRTTRTPLPCCAGPRPSSTWRGLSSWARGT
jgi:hypothetical protein